VREEKLSTLLSSEICEEEKNWSKYANQETQVKLDLADMLLEELARETAILINQI
jgi:hypothetical protein